MRERSNEAWKRDLNSGGEAQAAAIGDLRSLLLRAALYTLGRTAIHGADLGRLQIEQIAEECAQDALVAVLGRLPEFRSESKFTTWVYKFAVNFALTAARRERWKNISLDSIMEADKWPDLTVGMDGSIPSPERTAEQAEAWELIQQTIGEKLTLRQQQALRALAFEDVPLDELVRHLGSNRNAVYKLVHDARRNLKTGLEARGYPVGEILSLFGEPG